ncbi:hypothetical protein J2766_001102 [Agrobacterium tumefaciens]|uniref:Uncharacterized protein n=1 Tax=Agrobacterium tumefaciens TaxID=358 RepID=A0AAW8LSI6_AGRTU|nr:hypothetical protein [Agrobacterium tumefaciens]MDR6701592.1 hypothetical protein [Agrobacterium tumefaciens]
MAENRTIKGVGLIALLTLLPLAVNHVIFTASGFPALYCWFSPALGSLYMEWGIVLLYAVSAFVALKLFRGQMYPALGGVVVIIGIIELPNLAEHAFRLGGTCG